MTFRGAAIWMAIAGILGALLLWARAAQNTAETQSTFLLGLDSASVVGLRVEREDGAVESITRGPDGLWVLQQQDGDAPTARWPADESRVRGGVRLLASSEFGVRDDEPEATEPGPTGTLGVQLRGGVEKRIEFAGRSVGGRVPVTIHNGNGERLGWADRTLHDTYLAGGRGAGLAAWRDSGFGTNAAQADRLTVEALGERVELRRMGGRWMIQEPVLVEANAKVVEAVLARLAELRVESFLDRADPSDKAYGLTEPRGLIELGWPARGEESQRVTRGLTLGSLTNAAGEVLHASASWSVGDDAFTPCIVTVRVPEFPVSADSYLRLTASSLAPTDLRGVSVRRRSDNAGVAELTRTIDGWSLDGEPDRDGIGAAISGLVCEREAEAATLIRGDSIGAMPGYLGEFGLVAGGGVEAEVFLVALPTADVPKLRLIGKDLGDGHHAMSSYAGPDADKLVAWFVDRFGM